MFDLVARLDAIRLRAHEGPAQLERPARFGALGIQKIGEVQRKTGRQMHGGCAEVLHECKLLLGVARTSRNHQTADLLGPVVGHQRPGE